MSRKHRKFAESLNNWVELDELLSRLVRPRKYADLDDDDDCNDSDGQW